MAKVVQARKMAKNGDCHQFAPRHGLRKKALSLKRIGWLYPIFRDLHFYRGLLARFTSSATYIWKPGGRSGALGTACRAPTFPSTQQVCRGIACCARPRSPET